MLPDVVALEALPELALPAPYPEEVRAMGLSDAETDAYWRLTEELEREGARVPPGWPRHPARLATRRYTGWAASRTRSRTRWRSSASWPVGAKIRSPCRTRARRR